MHMNNQFGDSKNAVVNFMLDFLFSAKAKDGIRQILQTCANTFLALQNGSLYRVLFSEVDPGQLFTAVYVPFQLLANHI